MNVLQTRQRPAGTGREVETTMRTRREGYHGITVPTVPPSPRNPLAIAHDLYAAAEHLADMAEDYAAGVYDQRALSSTDALLVGCGRLVLELRQRGEVRP